MEITYPNKPTPEAIERFCKKIELFLSAHHLTISVAINDAPLRISSTINNIPDEELNLWIAKVMVKTPTVPEFEVELFAKGIEENMSNSAIWQEACEIQDQLYKHLKRIPGNPKESNDPYWKLWDYIQK